MRHTDTYILAGVAADKKKPCYVRERPRNEGGTARVGRLVRMRAHYYVLILYREGTNVRTYVKFLAPAA